MTNATAQPLVTNSSSILDTTKKMLGISSDYNAFDVDVIVNINSAIMTLNQLGIGVSGFAITDNSQTYDDLLTGSQTTVKPQVMAYIYLKTRLMFDPPQNSFTINSYESQIKEMEWRLKVFTDGEDDTPDPDQSIKNVYTRLDLNEPWWAGWYTW